MPRIDTTDALSESYEWCRRLTRKTAHNFYFSFLTLPRDRYDAMCALYAYMRLTDDVGDEPGRSATERQQQLADWRDQVTGVLAGQTVTHPLWPAFSDVCRKYQLPHDALLAVIDGVEQDLSPQEFRDFAALQQYCYRVAGAVGICCIHIWGYRDARALELAIDCGLALQLTNILRDLAEDAAMGRIYLPTEDLDRFQYSAADLRAHRRNEAFEHLMRFEVERARTYYQRAEELFPLLEPPGRPILRAMLRIYGGLLQEIERRRYDVYSQRVKLPRWRKLWHAAAALCLR